jgi:hypothetical protein
MPELIAMLACALLALLGFALLALSQERHYETVYGHGASQPTRRRTRIQRAAGFTMIGLSLLLCVASEGAGFGSLLWVVLISAASMAVAFTLTWRPHWLRMPGLAANPGTGRAASPAHGRPGATSERD